MDLHSVDVRRHIIDLSLGTGIILAIPIRANSVLYGFAAIVELLHFAEFHSSTSVMKQVYATQPARFTLTLFLVIKQVYAMQPALCTIILFRLWCPRSTLD